MQPEQRASASNVLKYEVIKHNLVLNTKPGDSTSTGVVPSARRAPEITASYNRNVAGCSAGPSEQIISTLKECKIGSSIEEEIVTKHKSTSSNGAGDPSTEAVGPSDFPESDIETALGNKAEVDKFLVCLHILFIIVLYNSIFRNF